MNRVPITVLSVDKAERWVPGPAEVCISIRSPGAPPAALSSNFRDVLRLYFHDLANFEPPYPEGAVSATDAIAREIATFVFRHLDAERIVVHCEAGISRSVAVALAISTTLFRYWAWPPYMPAEYRRARYIHNRAVYEAVCAALEALQPKEQVAP